MRRYSCCKRSTKVSINNAVGLNIRPFPSPQVTHVPLSATLHPERDTHTLDRMRLTIALRRCRSRHEIKAQGLSFDVLGPRGHRRGQFCFRKAIGDDTVFNVGPSVLE